VLWGFSVLDLASWELPETGKFFPRRAAFKQKRAVPSNDRSHDNSFAIHPPRGEGMVGVSIPMELDLVRSTRNPFHIKTGMVD
jgi:hypothetical protein